LSSSDFDALTDLDLSAFLGSDGESPFASGPLPAVHDHEERWSSALAEARSILERAPRRIHRAVESLATSAESIDPVSATLAPMVLYAEAKLGNTREQTLAGLGVTLRADVADPKVIAESGDVMPDSGLYTFMDYLMALGEQGLTAPIDLFRAVLDRDDCDAVFGVSLAALGMGSDAGAATTSGPTSPYSVLNTPVRVLTFSGRSVEDVLGSLERLEGLDAAKRMAREFVALERLERARVQAGMPAGAQSRHMVFVGNPGTGKTEVARLIAELIGAISGDPQTPFVEADRSMLVGEFLGTSALKTRQLAETAFGGVLFIDEAYSLAGTAESGPDRFGQEALDTLVKIMEDYREDLVVILAGYPEPMIRLMGVNPGLTSRISRFVEFPDYDDESLERIFLQLAEDRFYVVTDEVLTALRATLGKSREGSALGNARRMRNILERYIAALALRLGSQGQLESFDPSDLMTIRFSDATYDEGFFIPGQSRGTSRW
jgi:hypothetical protein